MAVPGPAYFEQLERDERVRQAEDRRNAQAFVRRRFAPQLRRRDVRFVVEVARGNLDTWSVGEVVCERAEELGAAAIVMAPHGRGRVKEWFVGSVCNHCLHHSKTPVVVVRGTSEPDRRDESGEEKR